MAYVGRSVMLSVGKEDEALWKEKVISVIIAKGLNALKKRKEPSAFKNDSLSQISSVGRALKRINRVTFHFFFSHP